MLPRHTNFCREKTTEIVLIDIVAANLKFDLLQQLILHKRLVADRLKNMPEECAAAESEDYYENHKEPFMNI